MKICKKNKINYLIKNTTYNPTENNKFNFLINKIIPFKLTKLM